MPCGHGRPVTIKAKVRSLRGFLRFLSKEEVTDGKAHL